MIQLDQDYANAQPIEGPQERPPAGGYVFQVLKAEETNSNAGKPMVALELDIAEGEFAGAFKEYPKKYYQLTGGQSAGYFKGMLKAFHDSNGDAGPFVVNNCFSAQVLNGLIVGGSLREEEYYKDGELKTNMKIAFLCGAQRVRDGEIKPLGIKKASQPSAPSAPSNSPQIPHHSDDDLPF